MNVLLEVTDFGGDRRIFGMDQAWKFVGTDLWLLTTRGTSTGELDVPGELVG